MQDNIRWAILGTGLIARRFAAQLPASRTGRLAAVGSRSPDTAVAFCAEHGGRPGPGYEAAIGDDGVDAVYVALPNGLHEEWTVRALEAGKHVLCEKPLARTAAEAERMFAVSRRTGRLLVEAFMYRASPLIDFLVGSVRSGVIGDLRLMRANFTFRRPVDPADARYQPDQGGGSLMDVGSYCVHFARALADREPDEMRILAHRHETGVDDRAAGLLRFGEFLVTFTCGMTVASDTRTFLAGTKGTIEIDRFWFGDTPYLLRRGDGPTETVAVPIDRPVYAREADAFAEAIRGTAPPWITPDDSVGNLRVLDELRRQAGLPPSP